MVYGTRVFLYLFCVTLLLSFLHSELVFIKMVIFSIQSILSLGGLGVVTSASMLSLVCYVVYQRFLHPLASYPGPLAASLTNIWKSYYVYNLVLHEKLVELHEQHGAVVRIGPNDLHFWTSEAAAPIYKAGKAMVKTEFYNAFTTFNPNLFGTTDEAVCLDFPHLFR